MGFVFVKDSVRDYGVFSFLSLRFFVGAMVLLPWAIRDMDRKAVFYGVGIGTVLFLAFYFQTAGLKTTTVSRSGLITSLFIVFSIVLNRLLFRVRISRWTWAILPVSLGGLALLIFGDTAELESGWGWNFGDLLTLLCAVGFGLHIVLLDRYSTEIASLPLACIQLLTVSLWGAAGALMTETLVIPGGSVWFGIFVCGIFCSAVCYLLQTSAQKYLPAVQVSFIFSSEPVFSVLFGVLLHHDSLTMLQAAGGVIMILSTLLILALPAKKDSIKVAADLRAAGRR